MPHSIPRVSREELCRKLESGERFVLVDALSPTSYGHSHLPGAVNLSPGQVDDLADGRIPDREAEILVYCSDSECDSSVETARRLLQRGYTNVRHYAEGKRDWIEAGLPVEGAIARRQAAT